MRKSLVIGVVVVIAGLATVPPAWAQFTKTNVVLGSSVAQGANAAGIYSGQYINGSVSNSYAARLTQTMATDGWWVENASIGGNDTLDVIGRFFRDVPKGADEILIALSLGNEGLSGSTNPLAICNQFYSGISNLIAMSHQNGSLPLLGGVYPRDDFTAIDYGYLKNMVLQFNTMGVPHVNFLGATDNGQGHWVPSLGSGDGLHPNDAGHYEMFLAIVPSVFDAYKAGKPTPQWGNRSRFVRILGDPSQSVPLSFTPGSTVHSFSMSFRVRASATGTVASVTLPGSAVHPTIEIRPTDLVYVASSGQAVSSGVTATNGAWHEVVVAHEYARGQTWFYVDGVWAGTASEQLAPVGFVLGGHGSATTRPGSPAQADYQDWFVYRSMLNAEEVTAQHQGMLQQGSLEIYAPLDDPAFSQGGTVTNRAQSLSVATINAAVLSSPPTASFSGAPTNGLGPLAVTFTDTSTGDVTNWFWDFGDGGTTNLTTNSIVHTYNPGTYTVTLTVSGALGSNTLTRSNYILAIDPAVAGFSGNPTSGTAPLPVTFTDASTGSITQWLWNFGDGNTTNFAISANPVHTYAAGTYTVSLTANGPGGTDTLTRSSYIVATNPPPPVAGFTGAPTNGTAPLAVTFTDTSTGSITNRFWDFGDGSTSNTTATSMNHTYSAGTYTVSLAVSGFGGSSSNIQAGYIVALNPAHLIINPGSLNCGSVTIGLTNSLSFSVINSGDQPLNGSASSAAPFAVTGGSPYNVAGGQTTTVTVAFAPTVPTTFSGSVIFASDGGSSTNAVGGEGLTPGGIAITPETLDFGTVETGTTAQASFVVTNVGGTTVSNGTAVVDGGPFTILSGATFDVPGFGATNVVVKFAPVTLNGFTNTVVLATANGGDLSNAVTGTGADLPVASFSATPTNGTEPLPVTFTDTSSGSITNLFWDLGDSTTTNTAGGAGFVHTYAAGTYTVTLIASNSDGTSTLVSNNLITAITAFQAWQLQYFHCTNNGSVCTQAAPDADPYGKGISNYSQFLLGLNPTDPASVFQILSIVPQSNDVVITWATGAGPTNVVQATSGDGSGRYARSFTDISGPLSIPGSGDATNSYQDAGGATNNPSRYYRIRLGP